jgi:hypothetical protein
MDSPDSPRFAPTEVRQVDAPPPTWVDEASEALDKAEDLRRRLRWGAALAFIGGVDAFTLAGTLRPTGVAVLDLTLGAAVIGGLLALAWYGVRRQRSERLPAPHHPVPQADFLYSTCMLLLGALFLFWVLPPVLRGTTALKDEGFLFALGAGFLGFGGFQLFQLTRRP